MHLPKASTEATLLRRGLRGIFNCASSLGTAIAVPLLTFLMLSFGWRVMFMIMGVAGLAMAAIWYFAYRNPTDVALSAEENVYRTQGDPPGQRTQVTLREWKQLFRFRTTWGMILGYFGCIYLTWIYTAWLPGYLEIERHMSVKFTGFAAAVPFAWGVVGVLAATSWTFSCAAACRREAEICNCAPREKVASFQGAPSRIVSPFRQIPNGRLAPIMLVFDIAKENFCAGDRAGRSNKTCTVTVLAVSHRGFVYLGHARLAAHPSDAGPGHCGVR